MRYPKDLQSGGTVGLVAPSYGCAIEPYRTLLPHTVSKWEARGYRFVIGPNCTKGEGIGISNTPQLCAEEWTEAYCSSASDVLISVGGGELMCETVEQVDWERIRQAEPKWFLGYSDNTNATFLLNTLCDVASVYGNCFTDFGQEPEHASCADTLGALTGQRVFASYPAWELTQVKDADHPFATYHCTEPYQHTLYCGEKRTEDPLHLEGRMLGGLVAYIAEALHVQPDAIEAQDLFLVNRQEGCVWGMKKEFVSSPKLDDLQAAFVTLKGFLAAAKTNAAAKEKAASAAIPVYLCFDNEEVGSGTMQGALSTFLADTLKRISNAFGCTEEAYYSAIARSFLISFDNAHGVHPNHPELTDAENKCFLNGGLVIKENAAQKYTTDALSRAAFRAVCEKAQVPTQVFANRSDAPGGSTLGNLSNVQVSVHAVDVGIAQLAMHSSYETAGALDTAYAAKAMETYYSHSLILDGSQSVTFR